MKYRYTNVYITVFLTIFIGSILCLTPSLISSVDSENYTMTLEANVFVTGPTGCTENLDIQAPGLISFGDINIGQETNKSKIYINNTGTVNVTITPLLESSSERIFNYTYFQRRTTDVWKQIGSWSFNLSASSTCGGVNDDYFYAKLNLINYPYSETQNLTNHKANITLWVMPQI
jgi:hypothetical protein